jgi:general secretion pathway protein L
MKIDLHAQVTFADMVAGAVRFLTWWRAELFALLPETWRAAYASWHRRSVLREEGTQWMIAEGEQSTIAFDTAHSDEVLREALARDAPEILARPVDIMLPRDEILIRRIELPDAAASRLRSTIGLQIERLSPFRAEDVGFDCSISARDESEKKVFVDVCIVPRKRMEQFEERLERLGLSADWFRIEATPFRVRSAAGARADSGRRRMMLAVGGAALLLWLGVVVFTPMAREIEIASTMDEIALLKPEAERAIALKADLRALQQPARLAATKATQPRPIDVLKTLTAVMPDTVRILDLTIAGRRVTVTGVAKNAPALIGILEKSGRFGMVHFQGPVTRRPDGRDRFQLEMNVTSPANVAGTT